MKQFSILLSAVLMSAAGAVCAVAPAAANETHAANPTMTEIDPAQETESEAGEFVGDPVSVTLVVRRDGAEFLARNISVAPGERGAVAVQTPTQSYVLGVTVVMPEGVQAEDGDMLLTFDFGYEANGGRVVLGNPSMLVYEGEPVTFIVGGTDDHAALEVTAAAQF